MCGRHNENKTLGQCKTGGCHGLYLHRLEPFSFYSTERQTNRRTDTTERNTMLSAVASRDKYTQSARPSVCLSHCTLLQNRTLIGNPLLNVKPTVQRVRTVTGVVHKTKNEVHDPSLTFSEKHKILYTCIHPYNQSLRWIPKIKTPNGRHFKI